MQTRGSPIFRSLEETVPQDWRALEHELRRHGLRLGTQPPRQFAGGLANLNYLLQIDDRDVVLRRPPMGPVTPGANDMAREWRVLQALAEHYPLAPHALHLCLDAAVLGAPFQLLEHRDGEPIGHQLPAGLVGAAGAIDRITDSLLEAMVALHTLDPRVVGLGDLGRPEEFLSRQVQGWERRGLAAFTGEAFSSEAFSGGPPPGFQEIVAWLRRRVTELRYEPQHISLLHGDLKPDNMLFAVPSGDPVAVIDWDMATRGDALFDLGVLLSYWIEPTDPEDLHGLERTPSLVQGAPTRRDLAERYATASGRDVADLDFHLVLGRLRLGVVWAQLHRTYSALPEAAPRFAHFPQLAAAVLRWTADTLPNPLV